MTNEDLKTKLETELKERAVSVALSPQKEVHVLVKKEDYLSACRDLRDKGDLSFQHLSCLTAIDYPKDNKITLVCHLWSYKHLSQLTLKVDLDRTDPKVPSSVPVWAAANWFEREVFDLYGVHFEGHPDLRRIMMPDDYGKYPLRKDFTDDGFIIKPN